MALSGGMNWGTELRKKKDREAATKQKAHSLQHMFKKINHRLICGIIFTQLWYL